MSHPETEFAPRRGAGQTVPIRVPRTEWRELTLKAPAGPPIPDPPMIERFTDLVRHQDETSVERFIGGLLDRGVSSEAIYLDLLAPTAARLGQLWVDDRCDFVEVTLAVGQLQRVVRSLSRTLLHHRAATPVGRALLACLPGEQHTLGMFMVADFLAREGFDVAIGPPLEARDLLGIVSGTEFDVIGLSVAGTDHVGAAARQISALRKRSANRRVAILAGGAAVRAGSAEAGRLGADAVADDARDAARLARQLTLTVP